MNQADALIAQLAHQGKNISPPGYRGWRWVRRISTFAERRSIARQKWRRSAASPRKKRFSGSRTSRGKAVGFHQLCRPRLNLTTAASQRRGSRPINGYPPPTYSAAGFTSGIPSIPNCWARGRVFLTIVTPSQMVTTVGVINAGREI